MTELKSGCGDPEADHKAIGLAHGYPPCCVDYFCELAAQGFHPNEEDCRRRGTDITTDWLADPTVEYVKCPQCRQ